MPTIGIKRDLLFQSLGKTYSEYIVGHINTFYRLWTRLTDNNNLFCIKYS